MFCTFIYDKTMRFYSWFSLIADVWIRFDVHCVRWRAVLEVRRALCSVVVVDHATTPVWHASSMHWFF